MLVMAFNGSPRKNKNTATLLEHALSGARELGAETELVHLEDIEYKGCNSCYQCKRIGGSSYGRCAAKDGITPYLDRIREEADALILGSPVYFSSMTGIMRCFFERLLYPYYCYDQSRTSLFPRKILTAVMITMNRTPEHAEELMYEEKFQEVAYLMGKVFGKAERQMVYNTYQFDDYSKYYAPIFPETEKAKQREEQFPLDCRRAYKIGRLLCGGDQNDDVV